MMTEEHVSKKFADKGLLKGARAPLFNTKDIHGEEVNLAEFGKYPPLYFTNRKV